MSPEPATIANAPAAQRATHLSLLDGLRGLAAMVVVLRHYGHFYYRPGDDHPDPTWIGQKPWESWLGLFYDQGVYAVNVFWMLSGFVFAHVYLGKAVDARAFAVHRLARLYPLHVLTLLVVGALQIMAQARLGGALIYQYNDWPRFFENLLFVPGWGFDRNVGFNGPIWSVSVEVLVYAMFWSVRGWLNQNGPLGALALATGAGLLVLMGLELMMLACAMHFFFGCAAAMIWRRGLFREGQLVVLACGLMGAGYILLRAESQAIAIVVGINMFFGGLILLLAGLEQRAAMPIKRACQWLGDCSYSTYLWHVPLQLVLMIAVANPISVMTLASQGWFLIAWLATVLAVGRLSFITFEAPARDFVKRKLLAPRKKDDTAAAVA